MKLVLADLNQQSFQGKGQLAVSVVGRFKVPKLEIWVWSICRGEARAQSRAERARTTSATIFRVRVPKRAARLTKILA